MDTWRCTKIWFTVNILIWTYMHSHEKVYLFTMQAKLCHEKLAQFEWMGPHRSFSSSLSPRHQWISSITHNNESWLLIIVFYFRALSYAWPFLCKINVLMDFDKFWLHISLSVEAESLKLLIFWHGKNVYSLKIFWASWRKKLYYLRVWLYYWFISHSNVYCKFPFQKGHMTNWLIDLIPLRRMI